MSALYSDSDHSESEPEFPVAAWLGPGMPSELIRSPDIPLRAAERICMLW